MTSQKQAIKEHLTRGLSITWFEAVESYGIGRLAPIINRLKYIDGLNIKSLKLRNAKTGSNWVRYKLNK